MASGRWACPLGSKNSCGLTCERTPCVRYQLFLESALPVRTSDTPSCPADIQTLPGVVVLLGSNFETRVAQLFEETACQPPADWFQATVVMESERIISTNLREEEERHMVNIYKFIATTTLLSSMLLAGEAFAEFKTYCFSSSDGLTSEAKCNKEREKVRGGSVSSCYAHPTDALQHCYDWDSQGTLCEDVVLESVLEDPAVEDAYIACVRDVMQMRRDRASESTFGTGN
jgi:hypothetical protein